MGNPQFPATACQSGSNLRKGNTVSYPVLPVGRKWLIVSTKIVDHHQVGLVTIQLIRKRACTVAGKSDPAPGVEPRNSERKATHSFSDSVELIQINGVHSLLNRWHSVAT